MARRKAQTLDLDFVPPWAKVLLLLASPLLLLNGAVAFFGSSLVFPLSPFFLKEKVEALRLYAIHRAGCLGREHARLDGLAARAEARHGLPAGLLAALVQVESAGHVHRISSAGAMGPGHWHGLHHHIGPGRARDVGPAALELARHDCSQAGAREALAAESIGMHRTYQSGSHFRGINKGGTNFGRPSFHNFGLF